MVRHNGEHHDRPAERVVPWLPRPDRSWCADLPFLARLGARAGVRRGRPGASSLVVGPGRRRRGWSRRPLPQTDGELAPARAASAGDGDPRRPRHPAALRRLARRPVARAGLRARAGPVLRDGRPPARHGRPALRAVRRRPRSRPTRSSAPSAGGGSPSRSSPLIEPEPRGATWRRTPTASTPTSTHDRRRELAVEYTVLAAGGLDYTREPWTPVDSLAWLKAMAWDLRGNMTTSSTARSRSPTARRRRSTQLYPPYPYDQNAADRAAAARSSTASSSRTPRHAAAPAARSDRRTPQARGDLSRAAARPRSSALPALLGRGDGIGSNSWVVSGEHTVDRQAAAGQRPAPGDRLPGIWIQVGPALPHASTPTARSTSPGSASPACPAW